MILVPAVALEVLGTLCLRASEGFTRPVPAVGVLLGEPLTGVQVLGLIVLAVGAVALTRRPAPVQP